MNRKEYAYIYIYIERERESCIYKIPHAAHIFHAAHKTSPTHHQRISDTSQNMPKISPTPQPTHAHPGVTWSPFYRVACEGVTLGNCRFYPGNTLVTFWELGGAAIHRSRFAEFWGTTRLHLLAPVLNTFCDPVPQGCLWRFLGSF